MLNAKQYASMNKARLLIDSATIEQLLYCTTLNQPCLSLCIDLIVSLSFHPNVLYVLSCPF